jgi:hypothetical protein
VVKVRHEAEPHGEKATQEEISPRTAAAGLIAGDRAITHARPEAAKLPIESATRRARML